jgi:hypothetical protein
VAAVAAVAVVVVDRAVRSAGKAFGIERELGPQQCGLSRFGSRRVLRPIARSGFTPKSALPIIAALGG